MVAFVVLLVLNFKLWKKDYLQEQEIRALQQELVIQQEENQRVAISNHELKQKIDSLKRGGYEMIEEEARHGFGMVGKGETFYHFKEKEGQVIQSLPKATE